MSGHLRQVCQLVQIQVSGRFREVCSLVVQVQVGDQVILESVKSPGQYLHVSKGLFGKLSVYSQRYVTTGPDHVYLGSVTNTHWIMKYIVHRSKNQMILNFKHSLERVSANSLQSKVNIY